MPAWTVETDFRDEWMPGILELMSQEWWTALRTADMVEKSLRNSQLVFVACDPDGEVVGMARVLTDFTYLAMVLDVMSSRAHRGKGIGTALMDAITEHPSLQQVDSIELVCQPELQTFYARWGFTGDVGRSGLMRRTANPLLKATSS